MELLVIFGVAFAAAILIRNNWVYRARIGELNNPHRTLTENLREHDRLPSYDAMMLRCWVWDVEKFKQ